MWINVHVPFSFCTVLDPFDINQKMFVKKSCLMNKFLCIFADEQIFRTCWNCFHAEPSNVAFV